MAAVRMDKVKDTARANPDCKQSQGPFRSGQQWISTDCRVGDGNPYP